MTEKMWGSEPFWGLGYEWDPDWVYTEHQKELRSMLIELCETQLRPNAKRFDDELMFPRPNLEILGEHGFLACLFLVDLRPLGLVAGSEEGALCRLR